MNRDAPSLPDAVQRMLRAVLADESKHPVLPSPSPETLRRQLDLSLPSTGRSFGEVIDELIAVARVTPRTTTTRFFNQLFAGREDAAVAGEILAAVLNNSMYTYKAAGVQILIEKEVLAHMASILGLPGGEGSFQAGGSLTNLAALLVARGEAFPRWREHGAESAQAVLYSSAESHYSIAKAVGILGIGRSHLRFIEVDEAGRMRVDLLGQRIQEDLAAGRRPFFINATAGTTVRGAFDPIDELAELARQYGLWLHVDGAFGASVALSRSRRHLLKGIDRADSVCWDPHKMMGVPLPCSALLLRRKGLLQEHLGEGAEYLFQEDDDELNPGQRNLHCGRHNDALKLWALWRHLGDEGWERRIERQYALAAHAKRYIEDHPRLVLSDEPACINVCFEVEGADSAWICRRLSQLGRQKIGHGRVKGRRVIRLVTANAALEEADLDRLFEDILEVAEEAPPPPSPAG